ncbi:ras-related protein Rap-2a [Hydra vulgaris]|uniref:ras-related protein Rap-2a n=1 Tax=Hydra vulgaris TaxID=6087 RepID=UPI0032E9F237
MNLIKQIFGKEKYKIPKEKTVKILVLGKTGVGKTSLIKKICNQTSLETVPTCYDVYREEILIDSINTVMEFMDFGGADMFPSMRDIFIRKADIFMLVYSCDDDESFIQIKELRNTILKVKNKQYTEIPIVVVRNKVDLQRKRKINKKLYATHNVSAVTGFNINEIMESLKKESKFIDSSEGLKNLQLSGRYIYDDHNDSILKREQYHSSPTIFRPKVTSDEQMQIRRAMTVSHEQSYRSSALF